MEDLCRVAALTAVTLGAAGDCWAWGATGHEWVSGIAIEKLPDSVPEFIRTLEATLQLSPYQWKVSREFA